MKRIFLGIFLLLFLVKAIGQKPKLLPDTSAVWEQGGGYAEYDGGRYITEVFTYTKFVISGDTVINNLHYKNLYLNQSTQKYYNERSPNYNYHRIIKYGLTNKVAVLRQDSLKVIIQILNDSFLYDWLKADSVVKTNINYILYDFGKTVGDTTYPAFGLDTSLAWVITKDTIVDGKRVLGYQYPNFHLTGKEAGNYLVEGMGYTRDFFTIFNKQQWKNNYGEEIASWNGVRYFCLDSTSILLQAGITECQWDESVGVINLGISPKELVEVKVYPNPVSENLVIINLPKNATVSLANITGKKMKEVLVDNTWLDLDVSSLPNGLYLLNIISEAGILTQKILKQ